MRHTLLFPFLLATSVLRAGDDPRFGVSVHTSVGLGELGKDVRDQLGFGIGLQAQIPVGGHLALRPNFAWTGFRVNDRNLGWKFMAAVLNASYDEERLVLRSYQVGLDLVLFPEGGSRGVYFFGGGGLQRAQLDLESRYVDRHGEDTQEHVSPILSWDPALTPYVQGGVGLQGKGGLFAEARLTAWRYRAAKGYELLDTPLNARTELREALSLTFSVGVRF